MREIRDILRLFEMHRDASLALATLVRAWGSSYRRPGARMLIAPNGQCAGSLSGGCLEEEVRAAARAVVRTGVPHLIEFDTRRRFGCHGAIEVFIERIPASFLDELAAHFRARRSCAVVTFFDTEQNERRSHLVQSAEEGIADGAFVQTIDPPIRVIIVGDGPDSAALCAFSEVLGWSAVNVADASELTGPFDQWTAAIVKTHNFGRDCAALRALAPHNLRYVGLVGPRKRRDQLVGDLFDSGVEMTANFFAPAGLDLRAEGPEEIALSIIAEIQAMFAAASGQSLRDRKAPIHESAPAATSARPALAKR